MEILTAIAIILILVTLLIPALQQIRARIERINCTSNLRELYVGANSYLQANGSWPQIDPALLKQPHNAYDEAWIQAYLPYGVARGTWICPTVEHLMGGPDYTQPDNYRADYVAMPYDRNALTPFKWPTQPWFVERANVHGTGNLLILANGTVTDLNSMPTMSSSAGAGQ